MADPQETGGGKMTKYAGPRGNALEVNHFVDGSRFHVGMCIEVMVAR